MHNQLPARVFDIAAEIAVGWLGFCLAQPAGSPASEAGPASSQESPGSPRLPRGHVAGNSRYSSPGTTKNYYDFLCLFLGLVLRIYKETMVLGCPRRS